MIWHSEAVRSLHGAPPPGFLCHTPCTFFLRSTTAWTLMPHPLHLLSEDCVAASCMSIWFAGSRRRVDGFTSPSLVEADGLHWPPIV
jgi:hypothetical protein